MNKRLEELNKLLSEYVGKNKRADERLFQIGVELGRELQRLEIENYRLPFFENQSQSVNAEKAKRGYIDKLNVKALSQVAKAVRAHIQEYGALTFNASYHRSDDEKLDDDIGLRHGIKHTRTSQSQVGGDIELYFSFVGKLAEHFTKNNVSPQFEVTLYNSSGEDYETVDEVDDEFYPFGNAHCGLNLLNESQSVEFVKGFCEDFDKHLTMHYMSVK
jgi:hypothetical protein